MSAGEHRSDTYITEAEIADFIQTIYQHKSSTVGESEKLMSVTQHRMSKQRP
jgi:hypothetical protein